MILPRRWSLKSTSTQGACSVCVAFSIASRAAEYSAKDGALVVEDTKTFMVVG